MRAITHTFLQARWSAAQLHNSDSYFLPPLDIIQTYSLHFTDSLGFNCYTLFNSPLISAISDKSDSGWFFCLFPSFLLDVNDCLRTSQYLELVCDCLTVCLCLAKTPSAVQLPVAWHLPQCAPFPLVEGL